MAGLGDRLGEILVDQGWLSAKNLEKSLEKFKFEGNGRKLGEFLIAEGMVQDDLVAKALAIQNGLEFLGATGLKPSQEAIDLVPLDFAKERAVLPLSVEDGVLVVAIEDPLDLSLTDDLRFITGMQVECKVAGRTALMLAIEKNFDSGSDVDQMLNEVTQTEIEVRELDSAADVQTLDEEDAPVVRIVEAIISNAVKKRASDIHIEAMEKNVRVRYRVDGRCQVEESPSKQLQGSLFSRIKMMAKMDIAERRKPQDGDIKIHVQGKTIDLRVSALPCSFGESIVMRILDKESINKGVDQLGFHVSDYAQFSEIIRSPNGIVLVTGPTGSGKTTTLYASLNERNRSDVKIITAEDPVEYNVSGINQIQVNHRIGLDFKRILRAMLRQAPNVILVGEIRDFETAQIAIEASLTGHLVLSTLHTNDAPSSVTRLIDMGVKPYLVSTSVISILAQRLIRLICEECKRAYKPDPGLLVAAGIDGERSEGKTFYQGAGCDNCNRGGFRGRIGIYELMRFNPTIREAIFRNEPTHVLRDLAIKNGMHTLLMDGVRKVFEGRTTLEEILRVAKSVENQ